MIRMNKMRSMRKIAFMGSRQSRRCICCQRAFLYIRDGEEIECPGCGTVNQIKFTQHGMVMITDKQYEEVFKNRRGNLK